MLDRLHQRRRSFVEGHDLVQQGETEQSAYILSAGWVCSYEIQRGGSRQIIDFQIPGDFLGLLSVLLRTSDHSFEPITDIEAVEVSTTELLATFAQIPRLATAVLWAARHARREVWVGLPAVQSILGTRLLPALLDRMMARKAYEGQLTQEDEAEGRPDNLFEPVAGDFGAHGRFDARARPASWQLWCSFNHGWVAAAAAVAAGGLFALAAALF